MGGGWLVELEWMDALPGCVVVVFNMHENLCVFIGVLGRGWGGLMEVLKR
jgi:hypothetical protein